MKTFSLSELNRHPGEIVDAALAGPVSLTKHGKPKLVVMDAVRYEILKHGKSFRMEDAPDADPERTDGSAGRNIEGAVGGGEAQFRRAQSTLTIICGRGKQTLAKNLAERADRPVS